MNNGLCQFCKTKYLEPLHCFFQFKELPTYKDADFLNSMEKIYVSDEEKEKVMNKLSRDTEVRQK